MLTNVLPPSTFPFTLVWNQPWSITSFWYPPGLVAYRVIIVIRYSKPCLVIKNEKANMLWNSCMRFYGYKVMILNWQGSMSRSYYQHRDHTLNSSPMEWWWQFVKTSPVKGHMNQYAKIRKFSWCKTKITVIRATPCFHCLNSRLRFIIILLFSVSR